ncbi:flavin-containing monooxygenase [Sphingomonas crocodyli]|uniref:NAD(P)/FAD-dependent oxidoreductase n=1 Tax=Sphingomonas crocodyli TaxID=1979270 RepID=A0A437M7R2_9SPHN|nr:NAD(P)/FAD-dependent oxidoreductase [Sphingomonas crocodyli]RVT93758.1 NAD(P)/FAD-dependent oxidoreductase [Sphingomonas crocodyli]
MQRFDAIVVGAGFAGMHMLVKLREMGMSALVIERGSDVGGTWYWNRYPGARCDVPSMDYSVPWDDELDQEWNWTERYAAQPEILTYALHLADRHDLRRDIKFNTSVNKADWNEDSKTWTVGTDTGDTYEARFFISGAGALSEPNLPDIPGIKSFKGELYHTGRWPRDKVALKGKRIAVLGTGSTGVQASTAIAKEADHLFVLQRTAQYSLPCLTPPLSDEEIGKRKAIYPAHREWQRNSFAATFMDVGSPFAMTAAEHTPEQRLANMEKCWASGTAALVGVYADVSTNAETAQEVSDFVRNKIRQTVKDPVTAERLCPKPGSYIGTRRIIIDTGYYQIFNQPNVTLVDITEDPIVEITETGVKLKSGTFHEIDMLVVATGYDAVTGPLLSMNITGKDGLELKTAWKDGPHTYLGLMVAGFPNLFTITGPSSPGVLANVIFSIDQHVQWIANAFEHMRKIDAVEIDTTEAAQTEWAMHAAETTSRALRIHDEKNWYLGTNIPGKPRSVLVYQGGLGFYKDKCNEIAADNYRGFVFEREKAAA